MSWGTAVRLTRLLRNDPSSAIAAAIEGWEHPASREVLALYDLFDLEHTVNSKKRPKPHPGRPGAQRKPRERMGAAGGRTPEEVAAILAAVRDGRPPV